MATTYFGNSDFPATFGFITVVEVSTLGHCGGLLVVSSIGRPIEFHFTAPVSQNRAQEIMYGKTYPGFLYGDRIGAALVDKAKKMPTLFVTDCSEMLPISELIDPPLVIVPSNNRANKTEAFDGSGLKFFELNGERIYCLNTPPEMLEQVEHHITKFVKQLPFDEPFERIHQAIFEANQVLRAS